MSWRGLTYGWSWRDLHNDRRWCSIHCRCWRSMAHSRRRTDVLQCRRWCGRHRVSKESGRWCCVLHWRGVTNLGLLQHVRDSARFVSTPVAVTVGAGTKKLTCAPYRTGAPYCTEALKTNLRLLQDMRKAVSIHIHTRDDRRRRLCRVTYLCTIGAGAP